MECLRWLQTVYWSDVKDRTVYQIPLSGVTTKQTFIDASQGLGMVDGKRLEKRHWKLFEIRSGVARQLCARGRAMKLAPPAPSLFFQILKIFV